MARRSGSTLLPDLGLGAAAGSLLLLLSWTAASTKSATFDEGVHLLSGFRVLAEGDYDFNHEHPPLMKMAAAAPLLLTGAARPLEPWTYASERDQWPLAHEWLYHRNDGDRLLSLGRFAVGIGGALLAAVVLMSVRSATSGRASPGRRGGARALGAGAGAAAAFLCAVEPNLLAHATLVTTDTGMALFYFSGAAAWWRYLETGRLPWMIASGALWGLGMAAKFTGVILGPLFLVMGVACILWPASTGRPERGRVRAVLGLARDLALMGLIALVLLSASYGFQGSFSSLRAMHPESAAFRSLAAGPLGVLPLPFPAPFVGGFDHAASGGEVWHSYLMGEYSEKGWRSYHLVALAVKVSLPLLALAAAGLAVGARAGAGARTRWIFLALPPGLLAGLFTFLPGVKNIGLRYVLGVLPFLCALGGIGAAALWRLGPRAGKAAAAILLAGAALAETVTWPDHLAYFNLIAGGPEGGRRWLVDSNLDWGQDLKGLGKWMRSHDVASIYLDYFGRACPAYEGIRTERDFTGGHIAVSVTNLVGVYREDERDRYHFLDGREPVASIGHSILVWNVPRPEGWRPRPGTPSR